MPGRSTGRTRDPFDPFDRPVDDTLDLHGFSAVEVRAHVPDWLARARKRYPGGLVHLITGRGRNSAGRPVLGGVVRSILRAQSDVVADWAPDSADGGYHVRLRR